MIILGVAGKPDTYRALPSIVDYITLCEGFIKEHPHKSLFTLFLPGIHQVWIAGVHGKLDMECAFTTSEEASSHIGRLLPYYSPRETYVVELATTPASGEPQEEDFSNYEASFVSTEGQELWNVLSFGRTKPYEVGDTFVSPSGVGWEVLAVNINRKTFLLTFTVA